MTSYECTAKTVNVFAKDITLPGRSDGEPISDHAVPTAATYTEKSIIMHDGVRWCDTGSGVLEEEQRLRSENVALSNTWGVQKKTELFK